MTNDETQKKKEEKVRKRRERKITRKHKVGFQLRIVREYNLHFYFFLYFQLNWPATYIVREAARGGDASDNVAVGVAGRADNTPAGIAATGRASERDWLVSPGRTAELYDPSYPLPSVDPLS